MEGDIDTVIWCPPWLDDTRDDNPGIHRCLSALNPGLSIAVSTNLQLPIAGIGCTTLLLPSTRVPPANLSLSV